MGYNVEESPCSSKNEACIFTIINGGVLTTVGIVGTILSTFTIYCLIRHVKLPYRQNLFILNVTVGDVVIALLGLVRGLGIISPIFVGYNSQTQKQNWWCATYTFIGNTLWMIPMPVLTLLTVDRFIAIVIPLRYKAIMKPAHCKTLVVFSWALLIIGLVNDTVSLSTGSKMVYQDQYHRCIFKIDRTWKKMFYSLIPFVAIIIMYTVMLIFLKKAKVESRKFLVTSFLIIATGVLAYLPDQLLIVFKIQMSYEVAQITTVTLWYTNSIWNPVIYFCINKQTKQDLAATNIGKKISVAAQRISTINIPTITSEDDSKFRLSSIGENPRLRVGSNTHTQNDIISLKGISEGLKSKT